MKYEIIGDAFQVLNCKLSPGEKIFAEAGEMVYASGNIIIEAQAKGGIGGMLKRAVTGESLFLTEFRTERGEGTVAFGKQLGKVIPINLNKGKTVNARTDSYMASTEEIDISVTTSAKRMITGLFSGKGVVLQTFTAKAPDQMVFLEASGQVITLDLEEGQVIKADTGSIVAFESTVDRDIQTVGGVKTMFFGGEGLILSVLKGPGKVWIQNTNLAEIIAKYSVGARGGK